MNQHTRDMVTISILCFITLMFWSTMESFSQEMVLIFFCAMAVSAVSITITLSKIAKPFRAWVQRKSSFLGDLTSCPYCFSHWGSLLAVLIFQPHVIHTSWWLWDYLITIFAMVSMASWFSYIIIHTYGKHQEK